MLLQSLIGKALVSVTSGVVSAGLLVGSGFYLLGGPSTSAVSTAQVTSAFANVGNSNCSVGRDAVWSPNYKVNGKSVSMIRDYRTNTSFVAAGGTVSVSFQIDPDCSAVQVGIASYKAAGNVFDPTTAAKQVLSDYQGGTFGPGTHTLSITVPNCFYQVDFFQGPVIAVGAPTYGGVGGTKTRLIETANGGNKACDLTPLTVPSSSAGGKATTTTVKAPSTTVPAKATTTTVPKKVIIPPVTIPSGNAGGNGPVSVVHPT